VRYNALEASMLKWGLESTRPEVMTPTGDRLAKSMLKAAVLLAASRQREDRVEVTEGDIVRAISYGEQWRRHVQEVMENVGKGTHERLLDNIYGAVRRRPGVSRSLLMQNYHLTARDMNYIAETLEQRGLVTRQKAGRTEQFFPNRRGD
jgi:hypothetical protein